MIDAELNTEALYMHDKGVADIARLEPGKLHCVTRSVQMADCTVVEIDFEGHRYPRVDAHPHSSMGLEPCSS